MKKRFLSTLLALCMVLTLLPGTARAAASGTCGANLTWTLSGGVLTISGSGAMSNYNMSYNSSIPGGLNGDSPWFMNQQIKEIVIGKGVTSIGSYAFLECEQVTKVTIPSSVTSIGKGAFEICKNLKSIEIPNGVTTIYVGTFNGCTSLTKVQLPDSVTYIDNYAFANCESLTNINLPKNLSYIGKRAFAATGLTSVELPESLTTITEYAFSDCAAIRDVSIPSSVKSIGIAAFLDCTSLTAVTISDGVESIGSAAFANCDGLTTIFVPSSVTSIGTNAFAGSQVREIRVDENNPRYRSIDGVLYTKDLSTLVVCPEGKTGSLVIPDGVTTFKVEEYTGPLRDCKKLTSVTIPSSVTTTSFVQIIESYGDPPLRNVWSAFRSCPGLTSAGPIGSGCDIEFGWTSAIPAGTFEGVDALKTVILPEGLTSLEYTFWGCDSLETVRIPDTMKTIGEKAFCGCTSLSTLVIPDGVTSIGESAFGDCASLTSLTIPKSVTNISDGSNVFSGCPDLIIYCYKDSAAHQYAIRFSIKFVLLDGDPDIPDTPAPTIQSVTLTQNGGTVDLLNQQVDFTQGAEETTAVTVAVDWDGVENGRVFLLQNNTKVELTSQPMTIVPGSIFVPDSAIYVIAANTDGKELDRKQINLQITAAKPEPEPEGTGMLVKDGVYVFSPAIIDTVDAMYDYHYDEHWFLNDSYNYQHDLVKMSIRGAMAAFGSGYASSPQNITALMSDLEFQNITTAYLAPDVNTIGYAIGSKTITPNKSEGDEFQPFSLIMVAVRGGGYYDEWGGNFNIGTSTDHAGFRIAADTVLFGIKDYINKSKSSFADDVKVWVMGYSRAAATTNLVAKELDDNYIPDIKAENVYAFCFECPQNTTSKNTSGEKYKNITCIANPIDVVTKVAMSDWGFSRYGSTYYLPYKEGSQNYDTEKGRMKAEYKKLMLQNSSLAGGSISDFVEKVTDEKWGQAWLADKAISATADLFENQAIYTTLHQSRVVNILKKTQGRNKEDLSVQEIVYAAGVVAAFADCYTDVGSLVSLLESLPGLPGQVAQNVVQVKIVAELSQIMHKGELFGYAHYPELCLSWLDSLTGKDGYSDPRYRMIFINCPVNVEVYDVNRTKVAEIIDDTVTELPNGIAAWIDKDDQKVVAVPNEMEYQIELTTTGDGKVTYTATEYDMDTGKMEKVVSYYEVEIEAGDTLTGTVENLDDKPDADYPLVLNNTNLMATVQQSGGDVQTYSVEPSAVGSGSVTGGGTYVNGEFAKVKAIPDSGAEFLGWYENDILVSEETEYRFLVDRDISITAKFTQNSNTSNVPSTPSYPTGGNTGGSSASATYSITISATNGGTVTVSPKSASKGTTVTVTVSPDDGYETADVTATDVNGNELTLTDKGNGKYTFTMPNGKVTVNAVFDKAWSNPFTDVTQDAWYYDAVKFANKNGLMHGVGNGLFAPDTHLSRAQLAQILYNKEERPIVTTASSFSDVGTAWYANAVTWAATKELVGGYGNGLFGPEDNITREQFAVILYRYAGSPVPPNLLLDFTDAFKVSDWAQDAVRWAVDQGILNGKSNGILDPIGKATRAEAAQMLKNYLEK